jgi:uncharacterized membrane-anchored protein
MNDYPARQQLHNEMHARPPHALTPPLHTIHRVMLCNADERRASREHLHRLLSAHHCPMPDPLSGHVRMDLGSHMLRWEMHTEFVTWTFTRSIPDIAHAPLLREQLQVDVPTAWLTGLPGQQLVHHHLWILPEDGSATWAADDWVKHLLREDTLVGSVVAEGNSRVYTDFALHAQGESRAILFVGTLPPRRLGRLVLQLLEIETYRLAALVGLPVARAAALELAQAETELAELATALRTARREDEAGLLDQLTRLAAQVEGRYASTHSRFSASRAYFELVDQRIADIAEQSLPGLQTLGEFMHRRLTPARNTCAWASNREDALSQRVSRMSNLLRTRVEIEQQQANQSLLDAMNQRQALQLKLQSTVEGLSVAAISYYVVGLLGYLVKGFKPEGWPLSSETTVACLVPVVALTVWWSLRRMHHLILSRSESGTR